MTNDTTPWWAKHDELCALIRWLSEERGDLQVADVVAILEKPWNWSDEHAAMILSRGAPSLFPVYARDEVDPEERDAAKVPLDGKGPVALKAIVEACEHFAISARCLDAAGNLVGAVDRKGAFRANESHDGDAVDALSLSLSTRPLPRSGARHASR